MDHPPPLQAVLAPCLALRILHHANGRYTVPKPGHQHKKHILCAHCDEKIIGTSVEVRSHDVRRAMLLLGILLVSGLHHAWYLDLVWLAILPTCSAQVRLLRALVTCDPTSRFPYMGPPPSSASECPPSPRCDIALQRGMRVGAAPPP
ncbi:uncharacterized protein B0H18DRAFT_1034583 [Fomitopsis serialis]|uniref:uncharacterized protein n=1 Tax=Fomitopsis serialis TaxID=139415 RepID=UPI0020077F69|nr:uncharacterized protein B0H18DRAFT_1034583 [Neoantrodia serialis]KAH9917425.1 hypothetical protein B0H18DRAFT_1034583 [Neoantrodia serialis]